MENAGQVPQEVWACLEYEILRAELEYADNLRAYRHKDQHLLTEFREAERCGCCGVFETSVVDDDGQKWVVACNYGH